MKNKETEICIILVIMFILICQNRYMPKFSFGLCETAPFDEFFMKDVMQEVKNYIGKPQKDYRVVSFGINSAAALYNGFYELDGYSTNYPLAHKKKFYEITKKEFQKDSKSDFLYKTWGSKVYLFSKDFYFFPKSKIDYKGIEKKSPDFNYQALKDLGCDYILSRYEIENADKYIKLEKVFFKVNGIIYLYSLK